MDEVYVTVLSSRSYLPGLFGLVRMHKKFKHKYPLVLLYREDVLSLLELKELLLFFYEIIPIRPLVDNIDNESISKFSYWGNTFDKLEIFNLEQFKKVVYLDSDMLIRKNLDELFLKPSLSACQSDKMYKKLHGNHSREYLNSGLMVIEPNNLFYLELMKTLGSMECLEDVSDQDIINRCLPNWHLNSELIIPENYNIYFMRIEFYMNEHYSLFGKNKINIVHFTGKSKPWMKLNFKRIIYMLKSELVKLHFYSFYFLVLYLWYTRPFKLMK
jgi:alpha-N-acetylglucosamine transferase